MSVAYPRVLRRVRAALIDSVAFVVLFYLWVFWAGLVENAHLVVKVAPLVAGFLILEPGLVAWTGGSIGHHVMGLRIRDAVADHNIGFVRATVRAAIRVLLGWVSLVFIFLTRKHQAIHDYVSRTVVVLRDPAKVAEHERFAERVVVPEGFRLPSRWRRGGVIVLYGAISYVAVSFVSA